MTFKNNLLVSLVVLGLSACGGQPTPVEGEQAPEFEGGGQLGNGEVGESLYPGPYGINKGSVVPNYQFYGYPRASLDKTVLQRIELAHFYNPTGTEVYPDGSPYGAGTPKPLALVLDRSAIWCGPCNTEAKVDIPANRLKYAPKAEFFVVLDDGPVPGNAAKESELNAWATKYKLDYPSAIDPNQTLSSIVGVDAYPGNVIVRTRDMKIIDWVPGVPPSSFWDTLEKVIDGESIQGIDE
jgi:hypothetical protein